MAHEAIPQKGLGGFFQRFGEGGRRAIGQAPEQIAAQQLQNERARIFNTLSKLDLMLKNSKDPNTGNTAAIKFLLDSKVVSPEQAGQLDFTKTIQKNLASAKEKPISLPETSRLVSPAGDVLLGAAKKPTIKSSFQQITDPTTGGQINALINTETGKIIKKFGSVEKGLVPKDKITVAIAQAKEFRSDLRIKNFGIIERSERGMAAALEQSTSPNVKSRIASDQALGVLFQKMLDPDSVVRESEYARTPEGASAINRLLAIAPQLRLGGLKLLDEDRQALVAMSQKLLHEAKISANKAFDEFTIRADEIGLNKKIIFGGAKKFNIAEEQQAEQQFQIGQTVINDGQPFRITGFDEDGTPLGEPVR